MSTSTVIILAVIVVLVIWAIGVYNSLISMRQRVNQAYADIDVQLRQRHDLIPNLVETVKGYAAHERGTLDEVVKARNAAMTAQGPAQQAAAENMLTGAHCASSLHWPRPTPTSKPVPISSNYRPR